ncbi:U-box domain-containing protein 44-like isoform X2 [Fagus crenata]
MCISFCCLFTKKLKKISRVLGLIPLASLDDSLDFKYQVSKLSNDMLDAVYKYWVNVAEEEVVKKIDLGIQARNVDRSYANHLLGKITEAVGISTEQSELKKEFEEFKREIEDLQR